VVAAFRFLKQLKVIGQVFLFRERNAVNTRQLLVLLVATPVSAGNAHDLHRLDDAGVRDMPAAAKVSEGRMVAERDRAVFQILDQLGLVFVILI
jgi:hypothetical protein